MRRALALGRVNHQMEVPSCALSLSHRGRVSVSDVDVEKMGSVAQWRNVPADIGDGGKEDVRGWRIWIRSEGGVEGSRFRLSMQRKGRAGERSIRLRLPLAGGLVEEMGAVWLWENDRSVDAVRACVRWVFGADWGCAVWH